MTTLYLIIKELNRSKQSNFKFIQNYVDSLKRVAIRCSNVRKTIESWLLSNLFLLDLNESLESYIFDLIQSVKINKFELLINEMTIALVNHDKRVNEEKNFSFKSMIAQFDEKKRKFESNKFRKESNKICSHCEQTSHDQQKCWYLHSNLRSDDWKLSERNKNLVVDFKTDFEIRIVRSMKIFFVDRASSCINVWWINIEAENHVCYDKNLFDEQTYRKVIENSIVTANNEAVVIIEKDTIIIDILLKSQSIKIQLNDVYHCSRLHYNLMSVEQVKVKEYTCSIQKGKFLFIDSMRVIILIDSRSDEEFYFVNASTNFSNFQTLTSRTHESIRASWRQWHKRLAHLNMTDVKRLVNMSIDINVNSINSLEEEEFSELICETCVLDKQHQASSRRSHTRVIRIDELIHSNLVDDDKILMIDEEFRYVVTMIDDYS